MGWYKIAKELSDADFEEITKSKWIPVDSSFINSVSYFDGLKMFEIKLKNGTEYSFKNVPRKVFERFMAAKSKGKFFNEVIKEKYGSE